MIDWVHSAAETEDIKVKRRKLNCYNGCINRKTKYSVVVNILFCAFHFYFIVDVCHYFQQSIFFFIKFTYSPFKEAGERAGGY